MTCMHACESATSNGVCYCKSGHIREDICQLQGGQMRETGNVSVSEILNRRSTGFNHL